MGRRFKDPQMKFLYNLGIQFYGWAIAVASLFNEKARLWRQGRKDVFTKLRKTFENIKEPVAWFHCSSLGEFEQGRPVIEAFRQRNPNYKILLTFFSPSGYEVRNNYEGADFVFYLPLDTPVNAKKFVEIVKPKFAVFVKYEFWYNYLGQLHKANVPVYLISAKFRPEQYFFKSYGDWFRKLLLVYKKIFVQDSESETLLKNIGAVNVIVAGDTRFDRVIAIAEQAREDDLVKSFKGNNKLWVCGSTWPEDEKLILQTFNEIKKVGEKVRLVIVPHEIGESNISRITELFHNSTKYSAGVNSSSEVLIVDKMGLLSSLYRYGDIAYVGGGFGKGIHNLPEAAVYGIPVLFGPHYHKFNEAYELIKYKGGASVSSAEKMNERVSHLLKDDAFRKACGQNARNYIYGARGATEKILQNISI
jgi:3-deoxy-D-manno-octulosonic-acid transferase